MDDVSHLVEIWYGFTRAGPALDLLRPAPFSSPCALIWLVRSKHVQFLGRIVKVVVPESGINTQCSFCNSLAPRPGGNICFLAPRKTYLTIFSIFLLSLSLQATRAAFPPKPSAHQPSSQPVNVVHPLRPPSHSIPSRPRDPKPARPPPPVSKSPMVTTKTVVSQAKLPPPKKPLPCSPVRTPLVSFAGWLCFPSRLVGIPWFLAACGSSGLGTIKDLTHHAKR